MEENKKCCENKECDHKESCCSMNKCCMLKKCHIMRKVIIIILLFVVFCLGAEYGELKSEAKGNRNYRGEMMNWDYKVVKPLINNEIPSTPPATTPELQ